MRNQSSHTSVNKELPKYHSSSPLPYSSTLLTFAVIGFATVTALRVVEVLGRVLIHLRNRRRLGAIFGAKFFHSIGKCVRAAFFLFKEEGMSTRASAKEDVKLEWCGDMRTCCL